MENARVGMVVIALLMILMVSSNDADLVMNFYANSCPKAEVIVSQFVNSRIPDTPSVAAALLRIHFHVCFVRGCDASVLLNFTAASGNQTEKDAVPNQTLRHLTFFDGIKDLLEASCPGIVSCADIVALVARDAVVAIGGPTWNVPTGRRDGVISNSLEALAHLPAPTNNFLTLRKAFAHRGLNIRDLVMLSGAHTIGIAHCTSFAYRLYNFTGHGDQDPALARRYVNKLKEQCKSMNSDAAAEMDPGSFRTFDLNYYKKVLNQRGLFQSDAALTTDSRAKNIMTELIEGSLDGFYDEFAASMEKMSKIGVKTGSAGEVRKHCAFANS